MTTRQRLIELAASQVVRCGNYNYEAAHNSIEHVAVHTMRGPYLKYYSSVSQLGLSRLIAAVWNRAQEVRKYKVN